MVDTLTDLEKQMLASLNGAIKAIPKQTPHTKAGICYWFSLYQMFRNSFTGNPLFQGVKNFDNVSNETLLI